MAERLEIILTVKDQVSDAVNRLKGQLSSLSRTSLVVAASGFAALGASMAAAIKVAMDAELVQADLAATLESTGGIAGVSAQEANALADSLARVTRFSDETIVSAESMLLTFTNIGEDVFPAATEAVLNMGEKFGSVEGAAAQLGKALNNPIEGVSALREVGVMLTDEQETMIRQFVEAGDMASAQRVILDELGVEVGGLARAMGDTAAGKVAILKNQLMDIGQTIGSVVLPAVSLMLDAVILPGIETIGRFTSKVADLIGAILNFGPTSEEAAAAFVSLFGYENWYAVWLVWKQVVDLGETIKTFVEETIVPFIQDHMAEFKGAFIALAAVLGAIAIAAVITGIGAAIAGLLNPITLLIAAIGVLGAAWSADWLGIRSKVTEAVDTYIAPAVQRAADSLQVILPAAMEIARWTWENKLGPALGDTSESLEVIIPSAIEIAKYAFENYLRPALEDIWSFISTTLYPAFMAVSGWLFETIVAGINTAVAAWNTVFKPAIEAIYNFISGSLLPIFRDVGTFLLTNIPSAIQTAINAFNQVKDTISDVIDTVQDFIDKLGSISLPDFNPFNAEGGPVFAGVPAIVGERGPEAFIPGSNGFIVPNDALSRMGGATNYNLTIYTSAPAEDIAADFNLMKAWAGS